MFINNMCAILHHVNLDFIPKMLHKLYVQMKWWNICLVDKWTCKFDG